MKLPDRWGLLAVAAIALMATLAGGCWNPFDPKGGDPEPPQYFQDPDTTTEVLSNFVLSWNQRNHDEYMKCLEEYFEFHLLQVDYDDYDGDGIIDEYWGLSLEEQFTKALFDGAYAIDL
ncbi:hypothetical protein JW921_06665, partial [Candidatus Fermentibacterales bacterium]|nr:hypothetical protein [Candidatus Fermentibacterales bacterium]